MAAYDYGGMRWSQTANYGRLPNPAMPHTFLAQAYDLADPWNVYNDCYWFDCCGPRHGCNREDMTCSRNGKENYDRCKTMLTPRGLTPNACDSYCRVLGRTEMPVPLFGILHSRLHLPIGQRLATAAARTVYALGNHSAEGPTLAGCRVARGGGSGSGSGSGRGRGRAEG